MKQLTYFLILLCTMASFAQDNKENERNTPEIISKISIGENFLLPDGKTSIQFTKVLSDSRCPEGTQCIWAGEVSVIVGMYDKGKFVKDINITFSPKDVTKNKPYLLFETEDSKYFATGMTPYPKEGSKIEPKEYAMEISIKPNA